MRPGRLNVHVQDLALGQAPSEALVLEAEVPGMGTVRTPPSSDLHWSKGVTLDLGPSHGAVLIVRLRTLDGRVLAKGSTTLEWTDSDRQVISVDLDGSGGSLSLQLRYFHCRAPGKERDELGRELVDELLIQRHSSSFSGSATETGSAGASPRAALEETRVPLRPRRGRPEATCA